MMLFRTRRECKFLTCTVRACQYYNPYDHASQSESNCLCVVHLCNTVKLQRYLNTAIIQLSLLYIKFTVSLRGDIIPTTSPSKSSRSPCWTDNFITIRCSYGNHDDDGGHPLTANQCQDDERAQDAQVSFIFFHFFGFTNFFFYN
jgi:hypothetical protein